MRAMPWRGVWEGSEVRMTDEERDQIRESVDIGELIGEDVELRQRGGRLWGRCPFHDERTPSFAVDPVRGSYYCFGCQAHGDVFEYVIRTRGVTFPEAAELLAGRAGITLVRSKRRGVSRKRISQALVAAASYVRKALTDVGCDDAGAARDWLEARGIGIDAVKRWSIGYAPGRGEVSKALRSAGFGTEEDYVLAPFDVSNVRREEVLVERHGAVGPLRAIPMGGPPVRGQVLFARSALFGMEEARGAIRDAGTALVTLAPIDAIVLHEAGVPNVVSTLGGGLGTRQARELEAAGARQVTLLYPDDGAAGTRAVMATLPAALKCPMRLSWEPLESVAQAGSIDCEAFARACEDADELVSAVVHKAADVCDLDDPASLLESVSEVCTKLAPAADGDHARARLLADEVSRCFGICDPSALMGPLLEKGPIGDESWRDSATCECRTVVPDVETRTIAMGSIQHGTGSRSEVGYAARSYAVDPIARPVPMYSEDDMTR